LMPFVERSCVEVGNVHRGSAEGGGEDKLCSRRDEVHGSFADEVGSLMVVVVTAVGVVIAIVRVLGTREAGCRESDGEVGKKISERGLGRDRAIVALEGE